MAWWCGRTVSCTPLPPCLLSWSNNLGGGAWYWLRFLLVFSRLVIYWSELRSFMGAASILGFLVSELSWTRPGYTVHPWKSHQGFYLFLYSVRSHSSLTIQASLTVSVILGRWPRYVLNPLACSLCPDSGIAHHFRLVSVHSIGFHGFDACLVIVRNLYM